MSRLEWEADVNAGWANILLIVFASGLQIKAPMLWSESRILRKLNCRDMGSLRCIIPSTGLNGNKMFAELYVSLSKGRQEFFGRTYSMLYFSFLISTEFFGWFLDIDLFQSEGLVALRALIYMGGLSVLGARRMGKGEVGIVIVLVGLQAGSFIVVGKGFVEVGGEIRRIVTIVRTGVLVAWLAGLMGSFWFGMKGNGSDISQIVWAIRKNKLKDGSRQAKRLEEMRRVSRDESYEREMYWKPGWECVVDIVGTLIFAMTNGVVYGKIGEESFPAVVVLESLELVSSILLVTNDSQVEPMLFVELLKMVDLNCDLYGIDGEPLENYH